MSFAAIRGKEHGSMNCCVLRPRYRSPETPPDVPLNAGFRLAQLGERLSGRYSVLRTLAVWASVLVFLSFPTLGRTHDFTNHLRAPLVRRSIIRHTSADRVEAKANEQIVKNQAWPQWFLLAEPASNTLPKSTATIELTPPAIGRKRLLLRLKLRQSPSNSQDPLI
jgi:hypothetical protein